MKNKLELMFARKNIVESAAEGLKNNYIKKTTEVRNSFSSDFYCLCSEFSYVDAVSCFAEVNCISNIFYRNLHVMDRVSWERFYKIFAIYNTIMFCRKNRKKLNINFIKWDMFYVYDFDETEQKLFELLWQMASQHETKFKSVFPQVFLKYVFRKNITDAASIAFTENFCYNSYNNLMKYFSRYISVSRRIKLAKQA